jgi:hypothetical protein
MCLNNLKEEEKSTFLSLPYVGGLFDLGVCKGGTILIWGYAEGHNFDSGVHEY